MISSQQVDEKVVSLAFNNANFEKNVKTSLSTLDKLKNALKFNNAGAGLANVATAMKNVSFAPINRGIQEVHNNFRALEVIGVTALSNITNSAMIAGTNMVKALTIRPIKTGFQEYETQINAIQTILANTQAAGTTLEDVNVALDNLNEYSDKTIYNFAEMTKNIGRFTAAGVDLQTSVDAIKGIANLAAVSGSTSLQASTAMYQLSQAIASGKVQLMDWNSVVNAGMGGKTFQEALLRTSDLLQTGGREAVETYGSFRASLTETGWLTSEVLTETLKQLSGAYTEADLLAQGFTQEQAADIIQLAATAESAATDVKTFTQLIDTTMEALQSGWAQTWELIIGDFNEAKNMFSEISKFFNDIIDGMTKARNGILEGAINPFGKLEKKLADVGINMEMFEDASRRALEQQGISLDDLIEKYGSFEGTLQSGWLTGDMFNNILSMITGDAEGAEQAMATTSRTLEDYQDIVNAVIRGDYGNGEDVRRKALEEAGWDYDVVQDLVNQQLWYGEFNLENLTDEQLTSLGLTEEQIEKVRELGQEAIEAGSETNELLGDLTKKPGHELISESVTNSLQFLQKVLDTIGTSFSNIFGTTDSGDIYTVLENINKFTSDLVGSEDAIKDFGNFLEGIFSIIKLGFEGVKGLFDWVVDLINSFKEAMGLDVSGTFSGFGQALKGIADWARNSNLVDFFKEFGDTIKEIIIPLAEPVGRIFGEFVKLFKIVGSSLMGLIDNLALLRNDFTFDNLYYVLIQFVESIRGAFDVFVAILWEELNGLFNGVIQFINDIGPHVIGFFTNLDSMISQNSIIGPFYKELKNVVKNIVKLFKSNGLLKSINKFASTINNIFSNIFNSITSFFDSLKSMKDNVTFDGIVQAFSDLFTGIYEAFANSTIIEDVVEFFSTLIDSILTTIQGIFSSIATEIQTLLTNLSQDKENPFSGIASFLLNAIEVLKTIPEKLAPVIDPIVNFVISLADQFGKAEFSIEGLYDTIKTVFGKIGEVLMEAFGPTKAYADEIEGTVDRVTSAGDKLMTPFNKTEGGLEGFFEKVKEIFIKFKEFVEETIGFDGLFAGALGLGVLFIIKGFIDKISAAVKPITDAINNISGGFKKAAEGWGDMQKSMGKAAEYQAIALIILSVAAVLGVLFLAFYQFSQLNWDQFAVAAASIGVLVLAIGILSTVFAVIAYALREVNPAVLFSLGVGIIALAGAVFLMASSLRMLDGVDAERVSGNVKSMMELMAALVVSAVIIGKFGPKANSGVGIILALAISIWILSQALQNIGELNLQADSQTMQNLVMLLVGLGFVVAATRGLKLSSVIGLILLVLAIKQMLAAVSTLASFDSSQFTQAMDSFIGLFIGIALLMLATKLAGKHALGGGVAVLLVTAALWLMVPIITMLGSMKPEVAERGIESLMYMIGGIAGLFVATAFAGQHALQAAVGILLASFALGVMAALVILLGHIKPDKVWQGLQALMLMVLALDSIFIAMGYMGKGLNGNDPSKTIGKTLAIIVVLMVALGVLSFIDPNTLMNTAQSMGLVLGALALALFAVGKIPDSKNVIGKLVAMMFLVATVGTILGLLAGLDANASIESAGAIAIVLGALGFVFTTISAIPDTKGIVSKIFAMAIVVGAIGLVLGLMDHFEVEGSLQSATAIGIVMLAMAASLFIIGQIKDLSSTALLGLVVMIVVLEMAANALSILQGMDPLSAIGIAIAIGLLLLEVTGVLYLASFIGPVAGQAMAGFAAVMVALGLLTLMLNAIGQFADLVGKESFDAAADVMATMGQAIGSFLGNIIGGLMGGIGEGIISSLPRIAEDLSLFAEKITGMQNLKASDFSGLDAALNCVKKAQEIGTLQFNKEGLNEAMGYITAFIQDAGALSSGMSAMSEDGKFDTTNFDAMISMCESLSTLQKTLEAHGGFIQGILGEKDLSEFGSDVRSFVAQMNTAIISINGLQPPDMGKFEALLVVSNSLSDFQKTIDGQGGFIEQIFGDNSLGTFGEDMAKFVEQVQIFITSLNSMTDPNMDKLDSMMVVSRTLQEFQTTLNGIGGIVDFFLGDQSLAGFGDDMATFVREFDKFVTANNQLEDPDMAKLDSMIEASKKMQGFQESLQGIGGIVQFFMNGDNSLATFGDDMKSFIKSFNAFYGNASSLDVDPKTLDPVIEACTKLQAFKDSLPEKGFFESLGSMFGLDAIGAFGEEMKHMGMAFASFETGLGEAKVDSIMEAAEGISKLVAALSIVNSFEDANASVQKLQGFLDDLGSITINATTMSALSETTTKLSEALAELKDVVDFSFEDKNVDFDIDSALSKALESSVTTVEGYEEKFSTLGEDLVTALTGSLESAAGTIEGYQDEYESLGESLLSGFVDSIEDALNGDDGVEAKVATVIETMEQVLSDETSGFSSSGKTALDNFVAGIEEATPILKTATENVKKAVAEGLDAGQSLIQAKGDNVDADLATGIGRSTHIAVNALTSLYDSMTSSMNILNERFFTAGANAAQGLVNGLQSKAETVHNNAEALALVASNALQGGFDEHSPSKLWYKFGDYATQGLIEGLGEKVGQVASVSEGLADAASNGIMGFGTKLEAVDFSVLGSNVKSSFADALKPLNNLDFDSLDANPVIRPVLDLTDVESKAATIGSMFNQPSLSIKGLEDLGSSIGKNQNGSEILSALNDLKKTLGTPVTNSYTINGITYDDGSNITNAVSALVHAAIVEGRM